MKKTRSKFFAAALAATTMAAFYAAPVMAAQEGLTIDGEPITAATSVTINGVTLSKNNLTALDTITSQSKLTSNGGSAITATTAEKYQATSTVSANQISNTVKNYSTDAFVNGTSNVINGTTITDTVYDAEGTMASKLALNRTSITGTVVGENANSTITLNQTSASLKSGQKGFTVNDQGVITIAGTNFNVAATGAVTAKGFTSNNGAITIKDSEGATVFNATTAGAVTASGKLTANGGSTITATTDESSKASSSVSSASISNSVQQWDSDNSKFVNAAVSSIGKTAITNTVYDTDGKTVKSQLSLNQTSATLKSGKSSVGINNSTGAITITAKDSDNQNALLNVTSKNLSSSATATTITAAKEGSGTATSSTSSSAITDTITNGTATATSKSTATAITDEVKLGESNATIKTSLDKNGITDTFTDSNGVKHIVATNASGTKFTGDTSDNTRNYSIIDGQKATFGGSTANQSVIDGGSATFTSARNNVTSITGGTASFKSATNDETTIAGGSITTNSLTLDEDNKWDEEGLTIGGTTLATNEDGELIVSGLDVDNVYLESDGFKLGETGSETFTVDTATGDIATKGKLDVTGSITAASYNGVEISATGEGDEEKVSVGGVDITTMNSNVTDLLSGVETLNTNTAGIVRTGDDTSGYTTTIEGNTAISGDGMVISAEDSTVSTKTKADGYYVKDGNKIISKLTSDTLAVGGENVIQVSDKVRVNADVYKINGENLAWTDTNGKVRVKSDVYQIGDKNFAWSDSEGNISMSVYRGTFGDTSGANTVVKDEGVYIKNGSTITTSLENGELNLGANALTDEQLGYINGMVTGEGTLANVTSINGAAVAAVAATETDGSAAGLQIAGVTLQDGNVTAKAITADSVNDVTIQKNSTSDNVEIGGVDITQMQSDVTQAGTDINELQQKTAGLVRRTSGEFSTTEIEGAVGVNNKSGFYVLGTDEEQTKVATISREGNMTLAGNIKAEGNASIAGTFITENENGKASLSSEAFRLNKPDGDSSVNTVLINNDGTARFGALTGENVRIENGVLTVNSASENGEMTISSAGIEAVGYVNAATYNDVTLAKDDDANILVGGINLTAIETNTAGIVRTGDEESGYVTTIEGNTAISQDGVKISDANGFTTINGGKITTGTTTITGDSITTDTLNVDKIVLGDKITDEDGNDVGNLNIGADGSVKLVDSKGVTTFEATTEKFSTHYGSYELDMDAANGFSLGYTNSAKLTLTEAGYDFSGALNLGADDSLISFTHNTSNHNDGVGRISLVDSTGSLTLQTLVDKVEELDYRTQGISYDGDTGSTTIASGDSMLTVDSNGTTFTNGEVNGTTNINGGVINADRSEIGNMVPGASGSGSSVIDGSGVVSDADAQQGHFEKNVDGVVSSSFEFTANADGYVSNAQSTENDVTYTSNVTNSAKENSVSMTDGSSSSLREQTATSITGSVIEGDKENSFTQTVDSTISGISDGTNTNTLTQTATNTTSSVSDGTNTNTLTQSATETSNSISDGTNTYSSSQTATGSVTKISDGTNSSTFEQSATGHVITTTGEDGTEYSAVITGQDVVINQGTESEVSLATTENRVTNLEGEVADLNRRVDKLDDRIDKVGAMAAAIANLRTMGYDPTAPTEFAIGIGQYRSDTGVALGLFHYPNRDFMLSLSVSTSGDEVMGGIGATWKFGRKKQPVDQAKVNKAEELKLAAQKEK
ncbi:MAG: YadA C-terminal domain-containing protein [Phascolarctobacterium sp.]|uniref:YadA C-terminal domain-containing protein n=1 Tax=Phascolarctobacterium sp. TaxID=2049039 RepID=UPI0026DBC487|nr:YadA C-terminal domain-containing protein [Phascolarctobacterium sp.]MDO4921150.1 YadA C-terminal domain-containing protein [Phascolarctobacterium sp.]